MISASGKDLRRFTDGPWRDTSPRWSPDGRHLAFLSDRTGTRQIWIHGLIDPGARPISRLDSSPLTLAWSADSTTLAYTAAIPSDVPEAPWAPPGVIPLLRRGPPRIGLFILPVSGAGPVRIPIGKLEVIGEPAWMPDGKSILISAAEPGGDVEIYAVPLSPGGARQITRHTGPDVDPLPSPDGSRIAWIARDARPQNYVISKLYVANADGSRAKVLAGAMDRDVTHIQWSSDSRTVYFLADDHGVTHVWSARADGNVRQVTKASERLSGFSLADNGRAVVVRSPGEIVTLPVDVAGAAVKLAAPNQPLLAARLAGPSEEIHFSSGGRTIQGWIVKPPGFDRARQYPLLVDAQDSPRRMCGVEFRLRAQIFAARDFVVLCANPRGTPGYGEEFGSLLRSNDPSDPFDDLMRGADYLVHAGFVDPARINIAGSVVAPWAIGQTERFRSAVAADPIVEFASDPSRDPQRSPIFFAADFKTPTLVIDSGASPGAATLYVALQSRHVDSALLRLPEAQRPSCGVLLLEAMLGWMRK